MKWRFPNFITNFQDAKNYWKQLFHISLDDVKSANKYWIINNLNNTHNDGNPIFTAVNDKQRLAVRIIQQPIGEEGDLDFDYWIDSCCTNIPELVISCCPCEENEQEILHVLKKWIINTKN